MTPISPIFLSLYSRQGCLWCFSQWPATPIWRWPSRLFWGQGHLPQREEDLPQLKTYFVVINPTTFHSCTVSNELINVLSVWLMTDYSIRHYSLPLMECRAASSCPSRSCWLLWQNLCTTKPLIFSCFANQCTNTRRISLYTQDATII